SMLLPVVALDDAIGLVVFAVSIAIAKALDTGAALSAAAMVFEPLKEVGLSLLGGLVVGLILCWCMKLFKSSSNRMCVIVATVFLSTALAETFNLSSLLFSMSVGAVLANMRNDFDKILTLNDAWTPPLFLLFFVVSGAELDLKVLPSVGVLGIAYLVARSLGKYLGAGFGATITHAAPNIKKYLGLTLLPQAGVAIGMSQLVMEALPTYGPQIRAVVLCATLVYEFVGPLITKICLTKAGEITNS
ncbi:MAG: cation:proton antiporter, partial [Oscillospiraceae bacterium]